MPTYAAASGAAAMRQAQQQTTDTVSAMSENSGALRDSHQQFAGRSAARLGGAASTDSTFDSQLTRADAISRAGIARLDDIVAQNRATASAAASATSPAAERAVIAALRNQMAQAHGVLEKHSAAGGRAHRRDPSAWLRHSAHSADGRPETRTAATRDRPRATAQPDQGLQ